MAYGHVARKILHVLNLPQHRGRWLDTRAVANAVHGSDWATQEEVASVRQSLRKLAERGDVVRFGGAMPEWRLARHQSVEPPAMVAHVLAELEEQPEAGPDA